MKKLTKRLVLTFFGKRLKLTRPFDIPSYINELVEVSPCGPRPDGRNWVAMYRFNDMAQYAITPQEAVAGLEEMVLKGLKQAAKNIGYRVVRVEKR